MSTRRKIAKRTAELDEALDKTLEKIKVLLVMTAIRIFASTVIMGATLKIFVVDEFQVWFVIGAALCSVVFWLRCFKNSRSKIYKELSKKQMAVELELAILLRKDLAISHERMETQRFRAKA